jgi:uncharacterized membrane protein
MLWSYTDAVPFYLVLTVGLVAFLAVAFGSAAAPGARSKTLAALRAGSLGVLVLILINPVAVREEKRPGPEPTAVFLLDQSRSMSLEGPISRAQTADQFIAGAEGQLPRDRRPTIEKYGFGRELTALSEAKKLSPTADETRLFQALEQLPARLGDTLPFGVFVFSDGRSTEPDALNSTAGAFRTLGVPIHVVPFGDERISGDVAVQGIDAPRDARPGTRVPIRVILRSRGCAGERTELSIRAAADPKGASLATLPVTLIDGEQSLELVIETDRAKGILTAAVAQLPHEAILTNNRVPFQISPRDDKLRVIYMEGSAPPEYRFIQEALEEDPNIKCVSIYVDNQYVARPVLHRVDNPRLGFPTTREELLSYDVVICSDIARSAFTPQQLEWTVELVNKRGGGFVMIGGHTSFGAGGWDQTIWDGLIPVDMSGHGRSGARSPYHDGSFRVVVPRRAATHPIWRIVDDPARNGNVLARMPMFHGTNLTDRLKPAATALGFSETPLAGSGVVTVFSCQNFGRGRTFAMATDSTIAWGTDFEKTWGEGDNRYFRKFWRNVIRWLTENRDGGNRRLTVETDKVLYAPGQNIQVKARAYDEKLVETDRYRVAARVRRPTDDQAQPFGASALNLAPQLNEKVYQGKLPTPLVHEIVENPGTTLHRLMIDVAAFDGAKTVASSTVEVQLIDDPAEFRDPRPDRALLSNLARGTGGSVIRSPQELADMLGRHKDATVKTVVTRSPRWDNPLFWLLFLGLLSAEWILRRIKGLA